MGVIVMASKHRGAVTRKRRRWEGPSFDVDMSTQEARNRTGQQLEGAVAKLLRHLHYPFDAHFPLPDAVYGGRHDVHEVDFRYLDGNNDYVIVSSKYQGVAGTAGEKIALEMERLAMFVENGYAKQAILLLEGSAWSVDKVRGLSKRKLRGGRVSVMNMSQLDALLRS